MSPAASKPGGYDDGSVDEPLLGLDALLALNSHEHGDRGTGTLPGQRSTGEGGAKPKTVKAVAHAVCPCCTGAGSTSKVELPTRDGYRTGTTPGVALVPGGAHLLWRQHDIVTGRGTRTPCRASGVALCTLAPRDGVMWRPATSADGPEHADARIRVPAVCRCGTPAGQAGATTSSAAGAADQQDGEQSA